ncbi:MAG TPA: hypothetical protein VF354_03880 [Candidatus Methanoperedens sp.]
MALKKSRNEKKIPIQATVSPALFKLIEEKRGLVKRSTFMTSILEEHFEGKK